MHLHPDSIPAGDAENAWQHLKASAPVLKWIGGVFLAVTSAMGSVIWWLMKRFGEDLMSRYEKSIARQDEILQELHALKLAFAGNEASVQLAHAQYMPAREVEEKLSSKLDRREFDAAHSAAREVHARLEMEDINQDRTLQDHERRISTLEGLSEAKR